MAFTPQDIVAKYCLIFDKIINQIVNDWSLPYRSALKEFIKIGQRIIKAGQAKTDLIALWHNMEEHYESILKWTANLDNLFTTFDISSVRNEFLDRSQKVLDSLPETAVVAIPESFFIASSGESRRLKTWKWFKRRRIGLLRSLYCTINLLRKLVRRSPKSKPAEQRIVFIKQLILYALHESFIQILFSENQKYLQFAAQQLNRLHRSTDDIKNELLELDNRQILCRKNNRVELSQKLKILGKLQAVFESSLHQINTYNEETIQRLRDKYNDILSKFQRDYEIAGTFALPNKEYDKTRVLKSRHKFAKSVSRHRPAWDAYFSGERQDWQKDIELSLLQLRVLQNCAGIITEIRKIITKQIEPVYKKAAIALSKSVQRLQKQGRASIQKLVETEKTSLLLDLRKNHLPAMLDVLMRVQFESFLTEYLDNLKANTDAISEPLVILKQTDFNKVPPEVNKDEVPFQKLIRREFLPTVFKKTNQISSEIQNHFKLIRRDIAEIDQIVEFNLSAALNVLRQKGPSATQKGYEVAAEGLERAENQIRGLISKIQDFDKIVFENLAEITFEFIGRVEHLQDSEKALELKLRLARAETMESIKSSGLKVWNFIRNTIKSSVPRIRLLFIKMRFLYLSLRKISGLSPMAPSMEYELLAFLTETQNNISKLPYVYQRLFSLEPLEDSIFFTGRDENLQTLEAAFQTWEKERMSATGLIGERGSGRTTLINFARRQIWRNYKVIYIDLSAKTVIDETEWLKILSHSFEITGIKTFDVLRNKLLRRKYKTVCIVENVQKAFLKTVNGFDALEKFLLFISQTNEIIYWLITCNLYSWMYLDQVINISKFFHNIIDLGYLRKEEIENMVLKRHRISGYQLSFEVTPNVARLRNYKKLSDEKAKQAYLQNYYFEKLNDFASGNISIAMLFWLGSIKNITKEKTIISPFIDFDYNFLYNLPADELFTLGAFLQHETLTVEEHAAIFHQDIDQSCLLINKMTNKALLSSETGNYRIHPMLYRPVVRTLKSKNIIQ